MKAKLFFSLFTLLPLATFAWQGEVTIETPNTQLLLTANEGGDLHQSYYGNKSATLQELRNAGDDLSFHALPAYGTVDAVQLPALQVQHFDGDLNLELQVTNYESRNETAAVVHTFTMTDKLMPLTVKVFYKAYKNVDVIETWTEISHQEKKAIILKRFDSGQLTLRQGDVWVTHLHGNWGAEAEPTMEPLKKGIKTIRNSDGARNSHLDAPELMLSLDGRPQEQTGRTIGLALCWSGNYELRMNTMSHREHHVYAGIDPVSSEYVLEPNEPFETPHLAMTYSDEGMGGVSRNFHNWARKEGMFHRGMKTGDILLNSWEGIYLDITEEKIIKMMDDIAAFGGELFVMDDGWFGDKYPRKVDNSSLGDWVVDKNKLPNGIKALTDAAKQRKIKFGIWIEPEMTNTTSELYEQHPDWVLQAKGREMKLGRGGTQIVLDMTNPKVQDFVFSIVDDLMTKYPDIDYIKWDANMPILNHGSQYLTMNDQSHLYIAYHRGFEKTCERIRAKYPDLTIQACASGGGRANWGVLPYFEEFWVSDNTDALQRIYMQWGTSYFFPAIAMASHISATPNHTVFRTTAMKYRIDVAMSGRLGMEIQPKNMSDDEKALCRNAIKEYKQIRPIVQFGDLYRLVSPYDKKGLASLMYVNEEKSKSVFFWWKTESFQNEHLPRVKMAGLDANKMYKIHELNRIDLKPLDIEGKTFSGAYLMNHGLEMPYRNEPEWSKKNDWSSRVLLLEAE